jgi:hypothetical protein
MEVIEEKRPLPLVGLGDVQSTGRILERWQNTPV